MSKKPDYQREENRRFKAATDARRKWLEATIVGPSTTLSLDMVPVPVPIPVPVPVPKVKVY